MKGIVKEKVRENVEKLMKEKARNIKKLSENFYCVKDFLTQKDHKLLLTTQLFI